MNICFSKSAISDLENIKLYYMEQGVAQVGQDFVANIMQHVEKLTAYSDMGRIVPEFGDDSIRELIHPPFRVVYVRDNRTVKIVRVWRSERLLQLSEDS